MCDHAACAAGIAGAWQRIMETPLSTPDQAEEQLATSWVDSLNDLLVGSSRHIALLAAWTATCGSLFFSEVLGWVPCLLCWYQRILMYPLAVVLAVGILRRDRGLAAYVLPLSLTGICVSLYHYLLIKTDWFPPPACISGVPCTVDYLNWLGFVNIPFLALTAFVIISIMMFTYAWLQPQAADDAELDPEERPARFDMSQLAVGMIIVAVVLAFMVGSTFV